MFDWYLFAQVIHLLCAIIFLGFIFADVMILPVLNNYFSKETTKQIKDVISSRARKVFPATVLVIMLTGGFMASRFISYKIGFFETPVQQLLMVKITLALLIVIGIIYSLSMRLIFKKKAISIMVHFHKFTLILGFIIVILAKVMLYM